MDFTCDICGQEMSLYAGVLSWYKGEKELSNFRITHRNDEETQCEVAENNVRLELYKIASLRGYMDFVQYLLSQWEEDCLVKDFNELKRIIRRVTTYINERLSLLVE